MHSISICFGPAATIWNLLFKTEEKAGEFYGAYMEMKVQGTSGALIGGDDFGQTFSFDVAQIHAVLVEDLDQSQLGQVERGLHNARSQAKAQELALSDPIISQSLRKQQMGPAVMTPFGGPARMS